MITITTEQIIKDLKHEYDFYHALSKNVNTAIIYREQYAEFALLIAQFIEKYDSSFERKSNGIW